MSPIEAVAGTLTDETPTDIGNAVRELARSFPGDLPNPYGFLRERLRDQRRMYHKVDRWLYEQQVRTNEPE